MKTPFSPVKSLLFGAGALATSMAIASAQQAFTTPVGYHTETIEPGFNVVAPNLVDAPLVSSKLTGVAGTTLTDANADLSGLDAAATHTIEFESGAWGIIAPGNVNAGANSVTTNENLMDAGVAVDDSYIIRKVRTLGDYFGSTVAESPFQAGDATTADTIWIPDGEGFKKAYMAVKDEFFGIEEGWKLVSTGNDDQAGFPIPFNKGLIIQRQGDTAIELTFTGHVKLTPTMITADAPFSYVSRIYPTGSTLGNSNLAENVVRGDANTATNIWIPDGDAFRKGYYALADEFFGIEEGWKLVSTGNDDQTDFPLGTANIIQRNQGAFDITLTPPDFYADL